MVTINLDGGTIIPLIKNRFWSNLSPILKIGGFVVDRKSADLLTQIYTRSFRNMMFGQNPLKLVVLLLTAKTYIYNKICTKSFRNAIGIGARAFRSDYEGGGSFY